MFDFVTLFFDVFVENIKVGVKFQPQDITLTIPHSHNVSVAFRYLSNLTVLLGTLHY